MADHSQPTGLSAVQPAAATADGSSKGRCQLEHRSASTTLTHPQWAELLVADLQRSVDYFSHRLGFECHVFGDPPNFATAARDAAVIRIALSDQPERLVPHWQIVDKMWDAYVRVDDVDAIYAEVQQRGAGIDYTIYHAPHGFREFGVQDPDGHDIAFRTSARGI